MATRRVPKEVAPPLPPLLVRVIHAACHAPDDPVNRTGHDVALADLGRWALVRVPSEGVLAPDDPDAYKAIEAVALGHLGLREAREGLKKALSVLEPPGKRDEIESAYNHFQSVSDEAYYYAGRACGIALAHLCALR